MFGGGYDPFIVGQADDIRTMSSNNSQAHTALLESVQCKDEADISRPSELSIFGMKPKADTEAPNLLSSQDRSTVRDQLTEH